MSLNPHRDTLARAGRDAARRDTPFQAEADAALAGFQAVRRDLERRVRHGEMTVKVARTQATEAAARLRELLVPRAEGFSPVPRVFLDRLIGASEARKAARDHASVESLHRETNRLLRQTLIEQQLASRASEFEGRAFIRSIAGGFPAPTLDSLLRFHDSAAQAGDDSAMEWGRRQLEAIRVRTLADEDIRRIDSACDRPDALNPRIVARYVEGLREASPETLETFVSESLASRDANACAAAFTLAREATEATSSRWVRAVLDGLDQFPDAALNTLRAWEVDARADDAEVAHSRAEYAATLAEADARFPGLQPPTVAELERMERIGSRPVAGADEPIGLTLNRRGFFADEIAPLPSPA